MSDNIIISIKPALVEAIVSGQKRYEYRKSFPPFRVRNLVIYSTYPVQKVVCVAEALSMRENSVSAIWDATGVGAGVSHETYLEYFGNRWKACAFELGRIRLFPVPMRPQAIDPSLAVPQSYNQITDPVWEKITAILDSVDNPAER